jgi:hypothetical protein
MLRRAIAIIVLVLVAVLANRLAVGVVVGLVSAVLWIVVAVALIAAVLWAWSTLKGANERRAAKRGPGGSRRATESAPEPGAIAPHREDPVEVEMRRIREQLREQGRG